MASRVAEMPCDGIIGVQVNFPVVTDAVQTKAMHLKFCEKNRRKKSGHAVYIMQRWLKNCPGIADLACGVLARYASYHPACPKRAAG